MIQPMNLSHTHAREAKQYHHWNQKHHHRACYSTSTSHAQRRRILRILQNCPQCQIEDCPNKHPWSPVDMTSRMTSPWDPVRQFWKWSDDDFSNHWQSLTYTTLIFRRYSSRFALRFKKVTPSHHILSSHFTKGRFLCENNEIARKKEQVPDFGSKVAGLLLFLLVCESASCFSMDVLENPSPTNINPRFRLKQQCLDPLASLKWPTESFLFLIASNNLVTVISVWKHPQSQLSPIKMLLLQRLS
jgi:hypothetical protein